MYACTVYVGVFIYLFVYVCVCLQDMGNLADETI